MLAKRMKGMWKVGSRVWVTGEKAPRTITTVRMKAEARASQRARVLR